jgi:hypothetical protein
VSWYEKVKILPQEIFSRLDLRALQSSFPISDARYYRALISGIGVEFLLTQLKNHLITNNWKLFISTPLLENSDNISDENIIFLKKPSPYLSGLPAETFHLIISIWETLDFDWIRLVNIISYLLKKEGHLAFITYLDGSPEILLNILKKVVQKHKDYSLKITKRILPDSSKTLRRILNKAKLGDVRIWRDAIRCWYLSDEGVYKDIFSCQERLFFPSVPSEYISLIKEDFMKELKILSYPLEVKYEFAVATGVVYK